MRDRVKRKMAHLLHFLSHASHPSSGLLSKKKRSGCDAKGRAIVGQRTSRLDMGITKSLPAGCSMNIFIGTF